MDLLFYNDVEEYNDIQKKIKELTERKNELNESIKKALLDAGISKTETPQGTQVTLTTKVSLKYDEVSTLKYLKENGLTQYIVEKIDTTKLNKELKESKTLNESIQPNQDVTYSLTVK